MRSKALTEPSLVPYARSRLSADIATAVKDLALGFIMLSKAPVDTFETIAGKAAELEARSCPSEMKVTVFGHFVCSRNV
jgi:hypothetical protein